MAQGAQLTQGWHRGHSSQGWHRGQSSHRGGTGGTVHRGGTQRGTRHSRMMWWIWSHLAHVFHYPAIWIPRRHLRFENMFLFNTQMIVKLAWDVCAGCVLECTLQKVLRIATYKTFSEGIRTCSYGVIVFIAFLPNAGRKIMRLIFLNINTHCYDVIIKCKVFKTYV